jgi:2-polyprenyl-3-methyl-5-hydroxy-6-metoxy-1,4-benzoquinol methylase
MNDQELLLNETVKYLKALYTPEYLTSSPGCQAIDGVITWLKRKPVYSVIDIGCGRGHVVRALRRAGFDAYGVDLVRIKPPHDLEKRIFDRNIWDPECFEGDGRKDAAVCFDVLEHVPREKIDIALKNIKQIASVFYFTISCRADKVGETIGEQLHLTVESPAWWYEQLVRYGYKIEGFAGNPGELKIMGGTGCCLMW